MNIFIEDDHNTIRRKIHALINKGKNDSQIARQLKRCRTDIIYWRRKFQIQTNRWKVESFPIKELFCNAINQESSEEPLTDEEILNKLHKQRIKISHTSVLKIRWELKIPSSTKQRGKINRRYLYFTRGRIIWSATGNHVVARTKKSIWLVPE